MRTFTDALQRSWSIAITVATVKRIRALAGIDLLDAAGGTLLDRLATDPVLLGDVLYAVVKPEADARGITDEDFGRGLAGDAIDLATTALLEEFVAFFPSPRRRVLEKALSTLAGFRTTALRAAEARLEDPALLAELEVAVQAALRAPAGPFGAMPAAAQPPGSSSGSAPASSESIPPS